MSKPLPKFQPMFAPGTRVEILVSTGFGLITGRIVDQFDEWLAIDPTSEHQRKATGAKHRPTRWLQVSHIVAINKTEEQ